ncbi:hypothetical protein SLA2020_164120 [Shorea laevis]
MDAKLLPQSCSFLMTLSPRHVHKQRCSPVHAVQVRPRDMPSLKPVETSPGIGIETGVYKDSWFDLLAINHLSRNLQATAGLRSRKSGYESLVETATMVSRMFDPEKQRELVVQSLEKAIPRIILSMIRMLLPQSQFTREYCAIFTTIFFTWLIGPSEVRESELNGRREKNVVHIKKCRFLEQTNCVGMCTNLCKMPSQAFIKDSMGMPVNMVPNFDDLSCEMIFGQDPPASIDDPALKQPCYKSCKEKRKHSTKCCS